MWRRYTKLTLLALAGFALIPIGCGDGRKPVFPVRGQVYVDGQPAPDCFVMFHPVDENDLPRTAPITQCDQDGNFALTTYVQGDGAPVGEYIVCFEWRGRSGLMQNHFEGPDKLKGRYYNKDQSKFRFTVEKKPNEIPRYDLTTKDAP